MSDLWPNGRGVPRSKAKDAFERSPMQERETAKRLGGRVTKGSGSGPYDKADVRVGDIVLIEAKTTKHKSFSVTMDLIDKIEGEAMPRGAIPIIEVELQLGAKSVVVMPRWAFDTLMEKVNGPAE